MPTTITTGAASAKGYGFGASSAAPVYVENVFSTYLYTGTGASQTITNGVDLSTKGGLVWIKSRSAATSNFLFDTVRGTTKEINSDTTDADATLASSLTAFNTDGFTVNSATGVGVNAATYVAWTFRKQPKFFDIVTYTGTGSARTISHNLGSVPGCIIVKRTDTTGNWQVYHRSLTSAAYSIQLNATSAEASATTVWNSTAPTSTVFSVGTDATVNANTGTYVAYLFAHDAGGFGLSGTDNVVSCGGYTGNGSTLNVNLGWEPQYILVKDKSSAENWFIVDSMRGLSATYNTSARIVPNASAAEAVDEIFYPTATGFTAVGAGNNSSNYIYIAIRRGPMKTPTDATKVFQPVTYSGTAAARNLSSGFPVDFELVDNRGGSAGWEAFGFDRLRGNGWGLTTSATSAEVDNSTYLTDQFQTNDGVNRSGLGVNYSGLSAVTWMLRRAPGFFDVVCTSVFTNGTAVSHNLAVIPELVFAKARTNSTGNWMGAFKDGTAVKNISLNVASSAYNPSLAWSSYFSSTTFDPAGIFNAAGGAVKGSASDTVIYLFATCSGVSKVGTYTGTGTTKQIDCGFTGGARFVLIKRTDSTADWYVWDTARGVVSGNDPYLLLNSTAAEVTNTDYIDPYSAGFEISSTAPAAINANGGTFIYLAIA